MTTPRKNKAQRKRIGQVSYYLHHGAWYIYYRDGQKQIRRRAADSQAEAAQIAAQVNAQLATSMPTMFAFTPLSISQLRQKFLEHHEHVLRSSLATVRRYRSATQHLENFAAHRSQSSTAHELEADQFVRYLRSVKVAANGHQNTKRRKLRDKGIRYILETCRSMYGFAAKKRFLPPYTENPFADLGGKRIKVEDAKRIFVFDENTERQFFAVADDWSFPIHFVLAKSGIRPGELTHLLVEDLDLDTGWMRICNKAELGWRIKNRRERDIPLVKEVVAVFRRVVDGRSHGPVFVRQKFDAPHSPLANADRYRLALEFEKRLAIAEDDAENPLSREQQSRIAWTVWRDAGAVKPDTIRQSFISITQAIEISHATCPKSWRHSFATLLQDAGVDPLIRQITLGHAPGNGAEGALGMTSVYTHTRPSTQKREIERAMEMWSESLRLAAQWSQGGETLAEQIQQGKHQRNYFVVLSPKTEIPIELEKLFVVLEYRLPSKEQLEEIARGIATEDDDLPEDDELNRVLKAASGLTRYEAENAFSLSIVRDGQIKADTVQNLKSQTLKKSGLLTLYESEFGFEQLGGLDAGKQFCTRALQSKSTLARPRGILLLGVPGTGKSAFAKALGKEVGRPTLVMDVGRLMAGLVDGKPKVFRDTAITNLTEFFERFRSLNVRSNPELDQLVETCNQIVQGRSPQSLRENRLIRDAVASELQDVGQQLDLLLVDRPRRNILRRAR